MTNSEKLNLARKAIHHTLNTICDDPRKYWLVVLTLTKEGDTCGRFPALYVATTKGGAS